MVREVRANLLAGVTPSEAAIVDAAARGVEVVRSHRRDIDALCQAAAGLLLTRTTCICCSSIFIAAVNVFADILVVAAGKPNLITAAMVKVGAAVIDVGINRARLDALLCERL